jgi:Kef-type K+ transport system membrane component KefB
MVLLNLDFTLPLTNPVIIFSLVLFIILFAPLLLNKLRIPHIIGLILAGVLIGPYGFNLLLRDSSIVLFGTVGLLYIMFTAGLEIDLAEFKKNRFKSLVFGLFTFLAPITLGSLVAYYMLGFSVLTSILLGGMLSSHTLLAYPIASRYGLSGSRSVTLTIGGTIITDLLALLVLAAVVGMTRGEIGSAFWLQLAVSVLIFAAIVLFVFPIIARWFFKKFQDNISQYIFVLAIVFLGSFLAELAGIEAIIGAFLSGLVLNRFIPHSSPLMNRIDFVGNALFIPFFLIGVGMLVDVKVLFAGVGALKVAGIMIVIAVASKFIAAWLTQKSFRLTVDERRMIFGLSNARVGATLAVVLVGYNIIIGETATGEPLRLFSEDVLNGTILMILVTCTISSLMVERAARNLALQDDAQPSGDEPDSERILISLAYPETVGDLVDLALMLKPKKSIVPLYALHVVGEHDTSGAAAGKKMMDKVIRQAAAADQAVVPLTRFDMNISNGIIYTIKEHRFTDVVIGLHRHAQEGEHFFGPVAERILRRSPETIYIYKAAQPLNTLKRIVVAVPPKAEYEPGFHHWFERLYAISKGLALPLTMYANNDTINRLQLVSRNRAAETSVSFKEFSYWDEFLLFAREVKKDDLFVIISSRRGHVSYQQAFEKLPAYLTRHFQDVGFILLYPTQLDQDVSLEMQHMDTTLLTPIQENIGIINKAGKFIKRVLTGEEEKQKRKK